MSPQRDVGWITSAVYSPARQQNIAKIEDVQWAVMETSGAISFIKKSDA